MFVEIGWKEILFRLALTTMGGLLIGFNRGERGRPAGMRTTVLVCLAASLSMIQANLLMNTVGRHNDSFIMLDLMRLPLGVLSGMGFIGAGAIIRRDNLVLGLTTAATLWFVTLMGLCFGGGQWGLGLAALGLAMVILSGFKDLEQLFHQDLRGLLTLTTHAGGPDQEEIRRAIQRHAARIVLWGVAYVQKDQACTIRCLAEWRSYPGQTGLPDFVRQWIGHVGIAQVQWAPQGIETASVDQDAQPQGTPLVISRPDSRA